MLYFGVLFLVILSGSSFGFSDCQVIGEVRMLVSAFRPIPKTRDETVREEKLLEREKNCALEAVSGFSLPWLTEDDDSEKRTINETLQWLDPHARALSSPEMENWVQGKTSYRESIVSLEENQFLLYVSFPEFTEENLYFLNQSLRNQSQRTKEFKGAIIDLRGNEGGRIDIAQRFVGVLSGDPSSEDFVVAKIQWSIKSERSAVLQSIKLKDYVFSGPLVLLIDGRTASAAEMAAGALRSLGRALLVGESTFGKGSVQSYWPSQALLLNSRFRGFLGLTTGLYYLPDGRPVQKVGLTPDLKAEDELHYKDQERRKEADLVNALPTPAALSDLRRPDQKLKTKQWEIETVQPLKEKYEREKLRFDRSRQKTLESADTKAASDVALEIATFALNKMIRSNRYVQ